MYPRKLLKGFKSESDIIGFVFKAISPAVWSCEGVGRKENASKKQHVQRPLEV